MSEYYRTVTTASLADLRSRLYEAYATQHADSGGDEAAALAYRRDIRPHQIALAAETGMLRGHIVTQYLTFVARKGAGLVNSGERNPA